MNSGLYTAASGMLMQQRNINVISNNLANIKTLGFRTQRLISTTFEQELLTRIEAGSANIIGKGSPIRILDEVESLFGAGVLEESENPYHMAIAGDGFFNIQGDGALYLTRAGNFTVDEEGYLALEGVGRVLGDGGALLIGGSDYKVNFDGSVLGAAGNFLGNILVTVPNAGENLEKAANGLYIGTNIGVTPKDDTTGIVQFALELSNVDMNRELSVLMQAQRNFQACSVILKGMDQINQKAVSQIASL